VDQPLGSLRPLVDPELALLLGGLAVVCAAGLLELSRTLAETYRGKWFAGNGRDLIHTAAVLAMAGALLANGFQPTLAALAAASLLMPPLLLLDSLPARRPARFLLLLGLVGLAAAPPLLEPDSVVALANRVARLLFY
jgi:hypothetical protein